MRVGDSAYSPRLRTGVILCGTGTAGAYQAGVLHALIDAGVKIDLIAGHGPGVATALCAAVDGGARLWDPRGPWTARLLEGSYRWRPALRTAGWGMLAALVLLTSPILVLVWAAFVYAASMLTALAGFPESSSHLLALYQRSIEILFNPPILPTIVPRLLVLAVLAIVAVMIMAALGAVRQERSRRSVRGGFWWRLVGTPLDAVEPGRTLVDTLWRLVRGASSELRPSPIEIGRRYVDVLTDNFGQPGFREVVVAVHDIDARRDLVGAVLPPQSRGAFESRRSLPGPREAEMVDFTGPQRDLLVGFLQAGLRLPVATAPVEVEFPVDSFWRGERHRWCDRPELAARLVDELAAIGVEQVILVSPSAPPAAPHALRVRPGDLRARTGEMVRSIETAVIQDAWTAAAARFSGAFLVRPDHNPIGPFDFSGVYDESSDRRRTMAELIQLGHDDAYRQFIEPIVATGEPVEDI
jgi:hypothetical protein